MHGSAGSNRILVVDDERIITDSLGIIFTKAGYDAKTAYSAEQALELLSQGEWVPHLAIIDVRLPQMNGIDLAIHLKAAYPDCHLCLFSGLPPAAILEMANGRDQSFQVLEKPVHPTRLLELASLLLLHPDSTRLPIN